MRIHLRYPVMLIALLITTPAFADSNATGGGVTASETVSLGAGPFNHAAGLGDVDNSVVNGVAFTGGFSATHLRFTGNLDSIIGGTWGSEADIQITNFAENEFIWQNPLGNGGFTSESYDFAAELTGPFAGFSGGTVNVQFFESFSDGPGPDSASSDVFMTFERQEALVDTNGVFSLGTLGLEDSANSVGEFAFANMFDTYSVTLTDAGFLTITTDEDPAGFTGSSIGDTEIAIFDAAGFLLAQNDDGGGNGFYSEIDNLALAAGDYTIAVAGFNSTFADGFGVTAGNALGDYSINASFSAVPEPGTLAFLGLGCMGLVAYRRRK